MGQLFANGGKSAKMYRVSKIWIKSKPKKPKDSNKKKGESRTLNQYEKFEINTRFSLFLSLSLASSLSFLRSFFGWVFLTLFSGEKDLLSKWNLNTIKKNAQLMLSKKQKNSSIKKKREMLFQFRKLKR